MVATAGGAVCVNLFNQQISLYKTVTVNNVINCCGCSQKCKLCLQFIQDSSTSAENGFWKLSVTLSIVLHENDITHNRVYF